MPATICRSAVSGAKVVCGWRAFKPSGSSHAMRSAAGCADPGSALSDHEGQPTPCWFTVVDRHTKKASGALAAAVDSED